MEGHSPISVTRVVGVSLVAGECRSIYHPRREEQPYLSAFLPPSDINVLKNEGIPVNG